MLIAGGSDGVPQGEAVEGPSTSAAVHAESSKLGLVQPPGATPLSVFHEESVTMVSVVPSV